MIQPKIEITGLSEFNHFLRSSLPDEVRPLVIRQIARRPALKAVQEARRLQPIGDTGKTASTIGIMRVANPMQTWVEVGYKGRSLGNIYTSRNLIVRYKRGTIKGFPWIFQRAGDNIQGEAMNDMGKDITNVLVRAFRKRGYSR